MPADVGTVASRAHTAQTDPVDTVLLLLVAVLMPTAAGYTWLVTRWLHATYQSHRSPSPSGTPIERIRADLCRLHRQLDEVENAPADFPAKNQRCLATRAAYLDALGDACSRLQVSAPSGRPVSRAEIYRAEADLRRAGLDVRPVM